VIRRDNLDTFTGFTQSYTSLNGSFGAFIRKRRSDGEFIDTIKLGEIGSYDIPYSMSYNAFFFSVPPSKRDQLKFELRTLGKDLEFFEVPDNISEDEVLIASSFPRKRVIPDDSAFIRIRMEWKWWKKDADGDYIEREIKEKIPDRGPGVILKFQTFEGDQTEIIIISNMSNLAGDMAKLARLGGKRTVLEQFTPRWRWDVPSMKFVPIEEPMWYVCGCMNVFSLSFPYTGAVKCANCGKSYEEYGSFSLITSEEANRLSREKLHREERSNLIERNLERLADISVAIELRRKSLEISSGLILPDLSIHLSNYAKSEFCKRVYQFLDKSKGDMTLRFQKEILAKFDRKFIESSVYNMFLLYKSTAENEHELRLDETQKKLHEIYASGTDAEFIEQFCMNTVIRILQIQIPKETQNAAYSLVDKPFYELYNGLAEAETTSWIEKLVQENLVEAWKKREYWLKYYLLYTHPEFDTPSIAEQTFGKEIETAVWYMDYPHTHELVDEDYKPANEKEQHLVSLMEQREKLNQKWIAAVKVMEKDTGHQLDVKEYNRLWKEISLAERWVDSDTAKTDAMKHSSERSDGDNSSQGITEQPAIEKQEKEVSTPVAEGSIKYCPRCGSRQIVSSPKFCSTCGIKF